MKIPKAKQDKALKVKRQTKLEQIADQLLTHFTDSNYDFIIVAQKSNGKVIVSPFMYNKAKYGKPAAPGKA
jgi:hypothetical protein